ncbi:MAG: hypothetical protein LBT24_04610 [Tannerella sp.]|nr:hypothetical protein [Tannerella sp.]
MKSFRISLKNVATTVACFAVSLMLFTGCEKDDPTPEPDGNGIAEIGKTYVSTTANAEKVYTLTISKSLLRSSAAATDTYVLLYVDKSGEVKTSAGVVTSSVGEALTLTPTSGMAFAVTVTADGITGISGNITFTDNSTVSGGSLTPFANGEIEITSAAITEDRVLGVPGMAINYVYNGGRLDVTNGKILTILPGTTIRFSNTDGKILITDGATVKMLGEDKLRELNAAGNLSTTPGEKSGHITLKGGAAKGSWARLHIETNKENVLQYVDLINGGSRANEGGVLATNYDAKISMTNCKISGSLGHGIYLYNEPARFTAFSNNVIEHCNAQPAYVRTLYNIPFDNTSNLTGNGIDYIFVVNGGAEEQNLTINATTVPYYIDYAGYIKRTLTINKGVTFYMGEDERIDATGTAAENDGKIIVNGGTGAGEQVTFTRLPNSNYYWQGFEFMDSHGNIFKNCLIEYGGNPNNDANIYAYYRSSISLENVALNNSRQYGFRFNNSTGSDAAVVAAINVTFSGNAGGNVSLPDGTVSNTLP